MLDADLFAKAAPGLRDVRLVQDGRELAYATDESFDDRKPARGTAAVEDRALYETVLAIPLTAEGAGRLLPGLPSALMSRIGGQAVLPAHVPVERVLLQQAPAAAEPLWLAASPRADLEPREELHGIVSASQPAVAFTIGANLQGPAYVAARVGRATGGAGNDAGTLLLQMRRRELCYQPLSPSPLTLLVGNEKAHPVRFDYAAHYQPSATPLLATLGPAFANPAYRAPDERHLTMTRSHRLLLACSLAAAVFLLTITPLLRRR